jgi:hypothetical protein
MAVRGLIFDNADHVGSYPRGGRGFEGKICGGEGALQVNGLAHPIWIGRGRKVKENFTLRDGKFPAHPYLVDGSSARSEINRMFAQRPGASMPTWLVTPKWAAVLMVAI